MVFLAASVSSTDIFNDDSFMAVETFSSEGVFGGWHYNKDFKVSNYIMYKVIILKFTNRVISFSANSFLLFLPNNNHITPFYLLDLRNEHHSDF
jgi:hypothetical protein